MDTLSMMLFVPLAPVTSFRLATPDHMAMTVESYLLRHARGLQLAADIESDDDASEHDQSNDERESSAERESDDAEELMEEQSAEEGHEEDDEDDDEEDKGRRGAKDAQPMNDVSGGQEWATAHAELARS